VKHIEKYNGQYNTESERKKTTGMNLRLIAYIAEYRGIKEGGTYP